MKIFKQAAIAVLLASTIVEVDGFNLPSSRHLEPAINRQLVSSVRKLDVKSINKSSGKLF